MACLYNRGHGHTSQASFQHIQLQRRSSYPTNITTRILSSSPSFARPCITMLLMRAAPMGYAKVDKVDAEEARHLKAQFLIHKALEKNAPTRRPAAAASSRGGGCRVVRPSRIGVRLKRLRIAVRSIRLRVCRSVLKHLRNLRRLGCSRS